jgi:hypothetical protein
MDINYETEHLENILEKMDIVLYLKNLLKKMGNIIL